jgi:hypothetical protein
MNVLQNHMDKSGERSVIFHLRKKNLRVKCIRADMKHVLEPGAWSKAQITRWMQGFEQDDFLCKNESRPKRPLPSLGPTLSRFLSKHLFASARIISAHFRIARDSVKIIPARELGRKKTSKRWLPHKLSNTQKKPWVKFSRDVLQILKDRRELQFDWRAIGDKSSFQYFIQSDFMLALSWEIVALRSDPIFRRKNYVDCIFYIQQAFDTRYSAKET